MPMTIQRQFGWTTCSIRRKTSISFITIVRGYVYNLTIPSVLDKRGPASGAYEHLRSLHSCEMPAYHSPFGLQVGFPKCALGNQTGPTTAEGVKKRTLDILESLYHNPLPVISAKGPEVISYVSYFATASAKNDETLCIDLKTERRQRTHFRNTLRAIVRVSFPCKNHG